MSKSFRVPHRRYSTIKERLVARLARPSYDVLQALDGVDLEVGRGEFLGIVGRNGSGKSTLLRCIAGIYAIDAGKIAVDGRLSPFVEMGAGFNGELAARDNVLVNAVLLGLNRRQAMERFDQIMAFAELEEFVDLELKNYSSGMTVRLAFSIAIRVDADVLLIDEVLAVGDAAFQAKCFDEFARLKQAGRTILFVTHDMGTVQRLCDRAVLLDRGRVVAMGDPRSVARRYHEVNADSRWRSERVKPAGAPPGRAQRHRPSAFGSDLRHLIGLTHTLALMDFKRQHHGSTLGVLWSVMRPLALFAVLYAVFSRVGRFDRGVADYPVYLLTAIVLWTYFAEATSGAVTCLSSRRSLLCKVRFPRVVIPLSVVLRSSFNLGMNLIAVAVLLVAFAVQPRLSWLQLPLLIAFLALLSTGAAMLLSALFVRYRDVGPLWSLALQLLLFGSSVFYVVTRFPEDLQPAMVANPLAMVFTQMRHALIDPGAPTAAQVAGGEAALAIPVLIVAALLALGLWVFSREAPTVAET